MHAPFGRLCTHLVLPSQSLAFLSGGDLSHRICFHASLSVVVRLFIAVSLGLVASCPLVFEVAAVQACYTLLLSVFFMEMCGSWCLQQCINADVNIACCIDNSLLVRPSRPRSMSLCYNALLALWGVAAGEEGSYCLPSPLCACALFRNDRKA